MAKRKDKIPGGIADKRKIKDFSPAALKQGTKVELEHTDDESIAREIAMDHLAEDKNYYKKLKTIHKSDKEVDSINKPLPLPDFFNKHTGLIPENHPDYQKAIDHITKEYKNNKNESNRLHDRYISGGGKYIKHKVVNKSMIEVASDGKQEIVEGKEPLKKPKANKPQISKDPVMNYDQIGPKARTEKQQKEYEERVRAFTERWNKLKKALNNASILDLHEEMHPDESGDQEQPSSEDVQQMQQDQGQRSTEDVQQMQQGQEPQGQEQLSPEDMQQNEVPQEDHSETEQKLIEALKNEGYSDPEIAYIVHGIMAPNISETESAKAQTIKNMGDIDVDSKKQNLETDLNHKKRSMDLEHQHAQRMKDLEFEHARMQSPDPEMDKEHRRKLMEIELQERELDLERKRQEIALEMEFKKRELELKLKHTDQVAQKKLQEKGLPQVDKRSGGRDEQN